MNEDVIVGTALVWALVLAPPTIIRFAARGPITRTKAIGLSLALFLMNHIAAAMMFGPGSHTVLTIGAFVCFYVLTWQTTQGAKKSVAEARKSMGYDT
jgi:hypothetical protein